MEDRAFSETYKVIVLGLDTTVALKGSMALFIDGEVNSVLIEQREGYASAVLTSVLRDFLDEKGIGITELDGIGVGVGPGSYTGMRVGISFAKGLALGLGIPLLDIESTAAMAFSARSSRGGDIWTIIDAKMGSVYRACYRFANEVVEVILKPEVVPIDRAAEGIEKDTLVVTPDELWLRELFDKAGKSDVKIREGWPDAGFIAMEAARKLEISDGGESEAVAPLYLRPTAVEIKSKQEHA